MALAQGSLDVLVEDGADDEDFDEEDFDEAERPEPEAGFFGAAGRRPSGGAVRGRWEADFCSRFSRSLSASSRDSSLGSPGW